MPKTARQEYNALLVRSRRVALAIVEREVQAKLPKGWKLWLAVGWGLTLYDADGKAVVGMHETADHLPRGVRHACLLAADFCDTFGYGNEKIEGCA